MGLVLYSSVQMSRWIPVCNAHPLQRVSIAERRLSLLLKIAHWISGHALRLT